MRQLTIRAKAFLTFDAGDSLSWSDLDQALAIQMVRALFLPVKVKDDGGRGRAAKERKEARDLSPLPSSPAWAGASTRRGLDVPLTWTLSAF